MRSSSSYWASRPVDRSTIGWASSEKRSSSSADLIRCTQVTRPFIRASLRSSEERNEARMKGRVTWVQRIRSALEEDRFSLLAQPIVDLSTGRDAQYELLLRMRNERGDLIPPGAFLYIAERLDLVQDIDRWVAGRAIDMLAERERAGTPLTLEVNLSGRSIGDADLLSFIEGRLADTGIDASRLIFEITETAAVSNIATARD